MNIVKNYALGYLFLLPVFLYACEYLDASWRSRATKAAIVMAAGLSAFIVAVIQNTEDKEAISRNNDLLNQVTRVLEPITNLTLSACVEVDLKDPQMVEVSDKLKQLMLKGFPDLDAGGKNSLSPAIFIDNLSEIFKPQTEAESKGQTSSQTTPAETALSIQTFTVSFLKTARPMEEMIAVINDPYNSDLTVKFPSRVGDFKTDSDKEPATKLLYVEGKLYISMTNIKYDPYDMIKNTENITSVGDLENAISIITLNHSGAGNAKSFALKDLILNVAGRSFDLKWDELRPAYGSNDKSPNYFYRFPEKKSAFPISKFRVVCSALPAPQ